MEHNMPNRQNAPQGFALLKHYVRELLRHFFADRMTRASAELSYYLLFSIFPISLLVSLLLSLTKFSTTTLLRIMSVMPEDVQKLLLPSLTRYLGTFEIQPHYFQIVLYGFLAIYFMSRTMSSLMGSVNRIYGLPDARSTLRQFLFEIMMSAGLVTAIALSFVLVFLGREISELTSKLVMLPGWLVAILNHGRSMVALGFVFLLMFALCYWLPNCKMKWRDTLPGVVFILGAWLLSTRIFTFYFNNFNRYDAIYGSIGAIMVLLLWLYMTGIIILLGFTVNFITMKLRKRNFIYKDKWRMRRRKARRKRRDGK